jgi:aerobic-type carbon monoxide dehydrogenase small subunit (CoxS/CutS family)
MTGDQPAQFIESSFNVNGRSVTTTVPPAATLLSVLRDDIGLTGTKFNCEQGECGACTVLLDDRPVNACLVLAASADGHRVTTIEGLSTDSEPHPIQDAFMACDASQCGYCTPGMVMSTKALLDRTASPTRAQIEGAIAGNYCRCTGYESIINAIGRACGHADQHGGTS